MTSYIHIASRSESWKQKKNLKIDSDSKSYLENHSNFNTLWFLHPVSKFWVSTLFRKLTKFPTTSIFRVPSNIASIKLKFRSRQITSFGSNLNFQQPPTTFRDHNSWIVDSIVVHKYVSESWENSLQLFHWAPSQLLIVRASKFVICDSCTVRTDLTLIAFYLRVVTFTVAYVWIIIENSFLS
jgi:hypothetical protein